MSSNLMPFLPAMVSAMFINAPDRKAGTRVNLVTGGRFVPGFDSVKAQELKAVLALAARHNFESANPGLPELPLTHAAREDLKQDSALGYMVSLYARSWEAKGYSTAHPTFADFVSAVLASEYRPPDSLFPRQYAALAHQYPPQFSPRLDTGCYWK